MNMDYCLSELKALLSIDSPSGFTDKAADYLIGELTALGYAPEKTRKGGVFCCLGGEGSPLVLMAHVDTLGGMISTIKTNGRITITPIGGLRAENCEAENCRIYSRFSGVYSGTLKRKVYLHFTVYEEVGHGASASVPNDAEELISVDMGCVGDGLTCTEREVSICAKDSGGPYNYAVTTALVEAAKSVGAKYAVDVYPHYGSDVEASLRSGWDVRHGLIGAGVYASHGYERSHIEGVENTLKLLEAYVLD